MSTNAHYEGMFLLSQAVAVDLGTAVDHIKEILTKAGADIIAIKKWDERRLAYEIKKQKRGTFILVYFSAPAQALGRVERDCNLSEQILRQLVTRVDHMTIDEMKAADAREELQTEIKLRQQEASANA